MLRQIMGPSASKMEKELHIAHEDAYLVKLIMEGKVDPRHIQKSPSNYPDYVKQLYAIDKIIGGHGLVPINDQNNNCIAEYINTGETYNATVLYDKKRKRYFLDSLGDFVERKSRHGITVK